MPRIKLSEFKSKSIILPLLDLPYDGIRITSDTRSKNIKLGSKKKYIVKVDEGIKKRFKNGLVGINFKKGEVFNFIKETKKKGFENFLVEEFIPHKDTDEKFLALERTRLGNMCYYGTKGGVDVENNKKSIKNEILSIDSIDKISKHLGVEPVFLTKLQDIMDIQYISFLEINPLLVNKIKEPQFLDLALEVDSSGEFFADGSWTSDDFIKTNKHTLEEQNVSFLAEKSSSSLKFDLINPNGSIFTIFSGGGASIVLADEIYNIGKGNLLANYAEYSGNPTEEETYIFAKNIISIALKSKAKNKNIIIAGGVANFTDIRETFKGIVKALDEKSRDLAKQKIKIFVRRGGPNQEIGLKLMSDFLTKTNLIGKVAGPEMVLTDIID